MKNNKTFSKHNLLIIIPLALVMLSDMIFTLIGQSDSYWKNYGAVRENNPFARFFLVHHYEFFILFSLIYGLCVIFLITKLKRPFNIIFSLIILLAHSAGASSWLPIIYQKITGSYSTNVIWFLWIVFFLIIAVIYGICIDHWLKIKNR